MQQEEFPASAFVPIAVIVVPSLHHFYYKGGETNLAGAVSLMAMSAEDKFKETGFTEETAIPFITQALYPWEGSYPDKIPILKPEASDSGNWRETVVGLSNYAYLPSSKFTHGTINLQTKYYSQMVNGPYAPSPYKEQDVLVEYESLRAFGYEENLAYKQTSEPSSDASCLSRLPTSAGGSYGDCFLVDHICNDFHTEGTQAGDWYSPCIAELGYMFAEFELIQQSIDYALSLYGDECGCLLGTNSIYWASTDYNNDKTWVLNCKTGSANGYDMLKSTLSNELETDQICTSRAFIQI